ncbi:hypothetical protein [Gelidibacter sp.]|uniref:hypothetical protein n=1 Tax=Gelidibacter sp. TaxID=2018083 RepID=UPI002CE2D620|nr:hypothetical protein [Gelidibacter sp.]HUH27231.1 hypothetical protein [Gelidibacter sp.]
MKQLFLLSVLIFIGCKSEPKVDPTAIENQEKAYVITAEDIAKLNYTDYILSADSQQAVLDWQKFQDLQEQIDLLKNGNLTFFKVEKKIMEEFILELKAEQPPAVTTPAIRSRMTVLETTLLRLQDLANLDNIKKKDLMESIKELLVANVNLILQINKKFEKEAQQIQLPVRPE